MLSSTKEQSLQINNRHPREIGAWRTPKITGFPISLRRFGNDADRDIGVSRSHGCDGGTAKGMSVCPDHMDVKEGPPEG